MAEKHVSLADQAYETIRTNILNLTYPPGTQLTEAKLASDLNMSRSPVRTAIKML
ncbi:GntR family transcriptional regulator, partial [Muricomes intestini]|uniref:GntR family transcriptional regulator n=1 Tax=Muricomes intestini TaxID=1796634 RepID=UPI002FE33F8F